VKFRLKSAGWVFEFGMMELLQFAMEFQLPSALASQSALVGACGYVGLLNP
jgi:hypothetical protein